MKKFLHKVEDKLGMDLDGDGQVGKPKPNAGRGGYSQPPQQQGYGQPPPQHQGGYGAPQGHPQQGGYGGQQQQHGGQYGKPVQGYQPQAAAPCASGPGQGNVKALFIGINYYGQKGQLSGCVNDVKTMQSLVRKQGLANGQYQEVVLVDDKSFPNSKFPTKQEILNAFRWLATNNRPGDTLFFHYSGHGGQVPDKDGDEGDGMDETLIPVDYKSAGQITDDQIFALLVAPLPAGVRMTAVMDCCHSGTAMDLPYLFQANDNAMKNAMNPGDLAMCLVNKKKAQKMAMELIGGFLGGGGGAKGKADKQKMCAADVVMLSGCGDSQTSADVSNVQAFGLPAGSGPGGAGGACTNALASTLLKSGGGSMRFVDLLEKMRQDLKRKGYKQVPQLSSSKPIDLASPFSMFGPLGAARVAPVHASPGYGQPMQQQPMHHQPAHPQQFQAPYQQPQGNPYAQQPGYSQPTGQHPQI